MKLKKMADKLRKHSIVMTTKAGSGHPTSCLSCAEIMSVLFFDILKEKDEFILSKGHAAPILYASLAEAGLIPLNKLGTLRQINSSLEGHPTKRLKCTKIATGSLGQGLSVGTGMALMKKGKVYVLIGDGETAEGSIWEAANMASLNKLNNLTAIIDVNRLGQSQETMHGWNLKTYKKKFKAFGWETITVNGHDVKELKKAFSLKTKKPKIIIAKTKKGKGISFLENKEGWHGKVLDENQAKKALAEIGKVEIKLKSKYKCNYYKTNIKTCSIKKYTSPTATRQAFGDTIARLGQKNKNIYVIDGDVKNSTKTQKFFEKNKKQAIEGYIAEQNMIGTATGISTMGGIPFAATFAAFLTRAYDFIRMAQYSDINLNIVGSHTGVSIGEDGPSQMGLEDLSMFISMPEAIILSPCDAISTAALTIEMANLKGIKYLRTIREKTPIIYSSKEKFPLGKFKVLKKGKKAVIIATGITVHEALKLEDVTVIDLYSIRPLDITALKKICKGKKIIVVEDHYEGGIGNYLAPHLGKIVHLYVKKIPHSGKPHELLNKFKIDAEAIKKAI